VIFAGAAVGADVGAGTVGFTTIVGAFQSIGCTRVSPVFASY